MPTAGSSASAGAAGTVGAAGAGATSGSGASGAAPTAGNAPAGGSNSAGGASADDKTCSPGKTTRASFAYPDLIQNCGFDGSGELAGAQGFFRSIKLDKPLAPGDTFSFSVELGELGEGNMELWGGTGECGEAHEHFATVQIPKGGANESRCMTAAPKTGTYPYLIWLIRSAGAHGDVTMCPGVSCPG